MKSKDKVPEILHLVGYTFVFRRQKGISSQGRLRSSLIRNMPLKVASTGTEIFEGVARPYCKVRKRKKQHEPKPSKRTFMFTWNRRQGKHVPCRTPYPTVPAAPRLIVSELSRPHEMLTEVVFETTLVVFFHHRSRNLVPEVKPLYQTDETPAGDPLN